MPTDSGCDRAAPPHSLLSSDALTRAVPGCFCLPVTSLCWHSDAMPIRDSEGLNWKPVSRPVALSLCGRTVSLEPLSAPHHAGALWQAVRGHDDLWTWMGDGPWKQEQEFYNAIVEKHNAAEAVFLAILPKSTEQAAGYASWMRIDTASGVAEIGNILLAPSMQRTTAATEALFLMLRHLFDTLGYRRCEWKCNVENQPSQRAAKRLGFTFEGIFRQHMVVKGRNRDTAWFSMLDTEWPAHRRAMEAWLDATNFDTSGRQLQSLQSLLHAH